MGFDNARKFLARVVAWDGAAYISLHYKNHTGLPGNPYQTIKGFIGSLEWRQRQDKLDDIYVCMGSQAKTIERINPQGKSYEAADRHAANVVKHKSFFMDVDVKPKEPDKAYANTTEALIAITDFIKATGLPKPNVIVASGTGGFHLYWSLLEAIPAAEWRVWAFALAEAARSTGLKFDSQCTVDSVRVLRVPDTYNAKDKNNKVLVKLVSFGPSEFFLTQITDPLEPFKTKGAVAAAQAPAASPNDELSAGVTAGKVIPRVIERVAETCPFIARTLETGGADNDQPLWFHSLGIAVYCEDGENVAHRLSDQHPAYNFDETVQEFQRVKTDHETRKDLGLTSCAAITASGAPECKGCVHYAKGKRPISLTPISSVARLTMGTGDMPPGYFREQQSGFIHAKDVDEDGQQTSQCLIPYPVDKAWTSPHPWLLHFTTSTPGGGVKDIAMPYESFATVQAASGAFKRDGMSFTVTPKVLDFMTSFIRRLQEQKETVSDAQAFGWYKADGAIDGFVFNGSRFTPQGEKLSPRPDASFSKIYTPEGLDRFWLEAVRVVNEQKRPALDSIIAAAFAAPLMTIAGHPGATLGVWSPESGIGKTTALTLAQAVWGSPKGLMGLDDTQNRAFKVAGTIRNLPLMWDEVKGTKNIALFAESLFKMSRGTEKGRLGRDTRLADQGEWETLMVYCSNASIIETVTDLDRATVAGQVRVFEVKATPGVNTIPMAQMAALMAQVKTNFGWIGLRYAKFLGENEASIRAQIEKRALTLESKCKGNDDERLWLAIINTLLTGAEYANKLGFTEIDVTGLASFLFKEFRRMQAAKKVAPNDFSRFDNVVTQLSLFLADKRARNTILTDIVYNLRARPTIGAVKLINDGQESNKLDTIQVQIAVGPKTLRFSEAAFKDWLRQHNIPIATVMLAIENLLLAQRLTGRLGVGTRFAGGAEPLWEINAAQAGLLDQIAWGD